jgi:MinD-like ATPase involved in chromosome partitioning or flagellar assembly
MSSTAGGVRCGVLVAAEGHSWEPEALAAVAGAADLTMLRRCLDLHDLLAVAATGTAQVAVLAGTGPGVDRDLVERLGAHQVATVAVVPDGGTAAAALADEVARLTGIGVAAVVTESEVADRLVATVRAAVTDPVTPGPEPEQAGAPGSEDFGRQGRVLAIWGPTGAPGRTTVAVGVAAALARQGRTLLVDSDPHGGAVGQHLGILDETSGLLAASRQANSGTLTPERLHSAARSVGDRMEVLTGLPRPDRWTEVRPRNLLEVLRRATEVADHVVVDAGFGVEAPRAGEVGPSRSREALVSTVLKAADELVVVGTAEPVGLTRLARLLVDSRQLREEGPSHVVVNRMRRGLGWREVEIVDMVARVSPSARVHFLPMDVEGADRAMQAGRSVVELGSSPLANALVGLSTLVAGGAQPPSHGGGRRTGSSSSSSYYNKPRRGGQTVSSR